MFQISTEGRDYRIYADTIDEREDWIGEIRWAVEKFRKETEILYFDDIDVHDGKFVSEEDVKQNNETPLLNESDENQENVNFDVDENMVNSDVDENNSNFNVDAKIDINETIVDFMEEKKINADVNENKKNVTGLGVKVEVVESKRNSVFHQEFCDVDE